MIVRSVRSINTMSGMKNFVIAVSCDMEHYPQTMNTLGVENKEVCYIYSSGTKKHGEKYTCTCTCLNVLNSVSTYATSLPIKITILLHT